MTRIGQLLLEHGWIGKRQLAAALERKEQLGGRLGTCLLEMGAVSEELLMRALGEQLGLPVADREDLTGVDESVYGLLPADLAGRAEAVAFRFAGGRLDVAMLAVNNIAAQDQIAFVVGKRVGLHIANEARLYRALEIYYGKPSPHRYQSLLRQLERRPVPETARVTTVFTRAQLGDESDRQPAVQDIARPRGLTIPPRAVQSRSIPLSAEEKALLEPRLEELGESGEEVFEELQQPGEILDRLNQALLGAEAADDVARSRFCVDRKRNVLGSYCHCCHAQN